MTCAACQARVQRVLAREPGVDDAGVNLMLETATVRYRHGGCVASSTWLMSIRYTGYGAELAPEGVSKPLDCN